MTESDRDELAQELMKIDGVMGVSFKTSVAGTFSSMLKSLSFCNSGSYSECRC
ncbi:hypothetical protein OBE_04182, partial [human gut metagenome]